MESVQVPGGHEQYKWIAQRFAKVDGVEAVVMGEDADGLNLFLTNAKTGKAKKVWSFPLRRLIFIDYEMAPNIPSAYDVMELPDPESMVFLGECKAKQFFKD